MGEHPSPGPAVAAGAEAERIEELGPEADERPPAAPEDPWKVLFDQMSNKRSNSFRQAILQGNRRLCSKALLEEKGLNLSQRLIRHVAYETLPREIDRKWYYDSYTCCPPPWFMITITLLEVAFFLYNGVSLDQFVLQVTHPRYLQNALVYHPQLRAQAWRYLTYIFMHAGIEHLGLNVVLQLLVGVPLEMVHGATRIGLVYVAGVVAGSLAVSVADMTAPVVGSSGGVYALVSAHLANIVMICLYERGMNKHHQENTREKKQTGARKDAWLLPLPHRLGNSPDALGVPMVRADHPETRGVGREVEERGVKAVLFQFTLLSGKEPVPVAVMSSRGPEPVALPEGHGSARPAGSFAVPRA
ncbi:rhomboid-related protein 3 isoform X4 [Myotis myotis]|uniref:rhomboid-related protein 3 isoform X4 n=1 Tax=Myotis myotis TaxID=51298 RepID=UPI00174E7ABD|nr:rhomboid-related protein 3 isoform X4 [Myotis myotis]